MLVAQLCLTLCDPITVTHQAPLSLGFSRQEYWSGLPVPLPGDLPNPGIKPVSLESPASPSRWFTTRAIWKALIDYISHYNIETLSANHAVVPSFRQWYEVPLGAILVPQD